MAWNTFSEEKLIEIVNEKGYALLSHYVDEKSRKTKLIVEDRYGYRYDLFLGAVQSGNSQSIVHVGNSNSIRNIGIWIEINDRPFILNPNSIYTGTFDRNLELFCKKCEDTFLGQWSQISQGGGCAKCDGKQVGKYNNLAYLRPDLLADWDYSKNTIDPKEIVRGSDKRVYWCCSKCRHKWNTKLSERSVQNHGCPKCNSSDGEDKVSIILDSLNIFCEKEYQFENCRNILPLEFDFYIELYNLCIEYHGPQHYRPVDFAGRGIEWAKSELKKNKKRDKIKEDYCYNNGINLLIIPHWEFNNIESILINILNELEEGRE